MKNDISINSDNDLVMTVIRGQEVWTALKTIGINIIFDDAKCQISGATSAIVTPSVSDIAKGFVNLQDDPPHLKQWASVLLGASMIIDFSEIENDPFGDRLINILWDIAYGDPVSTENRRFLVNLGGESAT